MGIPVTSAAMNPQSQTTSLQRLQNVEKRIVRVLELADGVMEEVANPSGSRKELVNSHCTEFMQSVKVWTHQPAVPFQFLHLQGDLRTLHLFDSVFTGVLADIFCGGGCVK